MIPHVNTCLYRGFSYIQYDLVIHLFFLQPMHLKREVRAFCNSTMNFIASSNNQENYRMFIYMLPFLEYNNQKTGLYGQKMYEICKYIYVVF